MSTVLAPAYRDERSREPTPIQPTSAEARSHQWPWLAAGITFAFLIPFLLTDLASIDRDLYYGVYIGGVFAFTGAWLRFGVSSPRALLTRNWRAGVALGLAFAAVMLKIVLNEPSTPHPGGLEFVAAIAWRGVLYGLADGVLLSAFPILAVFAAFAGTRVLPRRLGKTAVGALALGVSLLFTAVYHLGYSDFRDEKLKKPLAGDVIWSVPTLATLSPFGAPIAHAGLHVTAVVHSYETDLFLPPHRAAAAEPARSSGVARRARHRSRPDCAGRNRLCQRRRWDVAGCVRPGSRERRADANGCPHASRKRVEDLDRPADPPARRGRNAAAVGHGRALAPGHAPLRRPDHGRAAAGPHERADRQQRRREESRRLPRGVTDPRLRAELLRVARRLEQRPTAEFSPVLWVKLAAFQPLLTEPGMNYHYSNIGFEILGLIAARASGQSIESLYRERIFEPLGLKHTAYDPQGPISGPHARGYTVRPDGRLIDVTAVHAGIGAEGAVVSNAEDTARFLVSLMQGKLLGPEQLALMKESGFWSGGDPPAATASPTGTPGPARVQDECVGLG